MTKKEALIQKVNGIKTGLTPFKLRLKNALENKAKDDILDSWIKAQLTEVNNQFSFLDSCIEEYKQG